MSGGGEGQGRCERRSGAFVKIKKKMGVGVGGRVGWSGCERRSEAFVKIHFGGSGGGRVGGSG